MGMVCVWGGVVSLHWELCAPFTCMSVWGRSWHTHDSAAECEPVVPSTWPGLWEGLPGILESGVKSLDRLEVCVAVSQRPRVGRVPSSTLSLAEFLLFLAEALLSY